MVVALLRASTHLGYPCLVVDLWEAASLDLLQGYLLHSVLLKLLHDRHTHSTVSTHKMVW